MNVQIVTFAIYIMLSQGIVFDCMIQFSRVISLFYVYNVWRMMMEWTRMFLHLWLHYCQHKWPTIHEFEQMVVFLTLLFLHLSPEYFIGSWMRCRIIFDSLHTLMHCLTVGTYLAFINLAFRALVMISSSLDMSAKLRI